MMLSFGEWIVVFEMPTMLFIIYIKIIENKNTFLKNLITLFLTTYII